MRIRLDLAYDGTDFAGWATQPGLRTVQHEVETALATLLQRPVRITVAGRTDAGVHARGQVAHLDVEPGEWDGLRGRTDAELGAALVRRLAGMLPEDVRVYSARVVPDEFDARFSALERTYTYRIVDQPELHDPLTRRFVLWRPVRLDTEAMNAAVAPLIGLHDFAAFCKPREGATTIRTLLEYTWRREASMLVATVRADAFCHSMVRALVGAAVAVGEGKRAVEWPAQVLAARERHAFVVPAHGLTLEAVRYPADAELAARNAQTMDRRQQP